MKLTRRNFVKFGGLAAAAAICLPGSVWAVKNDDVLTSRTAQSFRDLLETEFQIWNSGISRLQ